MLKHFLIGTLIILSGSIAFAAGPPDAPSQKKDPTEQLFKQLAEGPAKAQPKEEVPLEDDQDIGDVGPTVADHGARSAAPGNGTSNMPGRKIPTKNEDELQSSSILMEADTPETYTMDRERLNAQMNIPPETVTPVNLSSSDINRIHCNGPIKDVIYSKEKGITVSFSGEDAFVKFLITRKEGKIHYSLTPSEIFVICNGKVYSLIAMPNRIPAQMVRLQSTGDRAKKNISAFEGIPFEKKILDIISSGYRDEYPDSFTVTRMNQPLSLFEHLAMKQVTSAHVDGEGLTLKVYAISNRNSQKVELSEKDFLRIEIGRPVAIAVEHHLLNAGDTTRVFIVEQAGGGGR